MAPVGGFITEAVVVHSSETSVTIHAPFEDGDATTRSRDSRVEDIWYEVIYMRIDNCTVLSLSGLYSKVV